MRSVFFITTIIFSIISINYSFKEDTHVKIYQFDYTNLNSPIGNKLIPIFDSIDYYLFFLFKKYEVKDYNYFHQAFLYMNQKKICGKKIPDLKFDSNLLIQRDISFLIIPRLEQKKKLKKILDIKETLCNGYFGIARVIVLTINYNDAKSFEKFVTEELNRKLLFNEFMKKIMGNSILNYYHLKRNKLVSPFPENYLYYSSYEKFLNLVNIENNEQYSYNFSNIGKTPFYPDMPYFNDFLIEDKNTIKFLESSITEITLNILEEYPYEVAKCDLLYNYNYNNKKKCIRVDQKCIDICSFEKMFLEYYIDDKNKKIICNLNDKNNLINKQCSNLYGNTFFDEYFEPKKMNEFLSSKKQQNLLTLKPYNKCKNNLNTVFFEYSDFYKDDPYYYKKYNYKVEYTELTDPNNFVIAKLDKNNNYLTKFKNLIFNNIFVKNEKNWNYNLYWDYPYPNIEANNYNKYILLGKFPDEGINRHNIYFYYDKLRQQYPNDFNYIPETYFIPNQISIVKKKFKDYKFSSDNAWIINEENKDEYNNNSTKTEYPKIIKSFDKIINNIKKEEKLFISEYISNPLLINNKKFTMRNFVLVTGFSPLKIYIYRDGYLIFGQDEYNLNESNYKDICTHITTEKNEIICEKKNKKNKKQPYEQSLFEENCSIWSLINFERYCKKYDINYNDIINQAKDIIIKTFISLNEEVINSYESKLLKDRNMFQLFTFDFIIDQNLKLNLIDVDKNPKLDSKHLVPIYIYDHLFSDILNIVGVIPFNHESVNNDNNNLYKNEVEENVEEAICEFGRVRGMFELAFPLKNKINLYKKYFGNDLSKENELLWKNIEKNGDYI